MSEDSCNYSEPRGNAERLRAICRLNPGSRINVDKAMALAVAGQLVGLEAENAKNFKKLCETEVELSKCSLLLSSYRKEMR